MVFLAHVAYGMTFRQSIIEIIRKTAAEWDKIYIEAIADFSGC